MKQVLFSVFFISLMVVGAQAQKTTCSKSTCTAKPAGTAMGTSACGANKSASATQGSVEYNAAAAKLASLDPTIETRTCPVSGTVSYVRKQAGTGSAEATYVDLAYDATSNSFVNVSPLTTQSSVKAEGASGCSSKGGSANGKSCCAGAGKTASSTTTTTTTTATGTATPACCAGKTKSASAGSNKN